MHKVVKYGLIAAGALVGLGVLAVAAGVAYVSFALPNAGPVQDVTVEGTPEQVARGEYLAFHVAGCAQCHSPVDEGRYGHPIPDGMLGAGGTRFPGPGTIYAPNITPAGAVGDWTDAELFHALTTGITPDRRALFPMMDWPAYGKSSQDDVEAIIAWIRSLEPVENDVPATELDPPLNVIVKLMPQPAETAPMPDPSDTVAYGEYLARFGGCKGCHSPMDDRGGYLPGLEFSGGMEFPMPGGTSISANISPDPETGIGDWSREQFVARFRAAALDPRLGESIPHGAPNTAMPWVAISGQTDADLGAIHDYLQTVPPVRREHPTRWVPEEGTSESALPIEPVNARTLQVLCDAGETWDGASQEALTADATALAEARGVPEFSAFLDAMGGVAPEERDAWLRGHLDEHGLTEACPAWTTPPADTGEE